METIPHGYQKTKVGIIPNDWKVMKLGDIFQFKNGLNKEKEFFGFGTPIINYMDVNKHNGLNTTDIKGLVSVTANELKNHNAKKGDVFFTRTSETIDEIGLSAVLLNDTINTVFSGFILRARPKSVILSDLYKKYCFNSYLTRKEIIRKSSYTTRALTNGRFLSEVLIPIPDISEQEKIAEILTTWDDSISIKNELIKEKEEQKKGLIQKLYCADIRFDEFDSEWKITTLNNILHHESRAIDKPKNGYWRLGLRSHAKGTFHQYIEDPKTVSMDTLYEVKENDLIVNITFAWEHALALISKDDEGKLVSHRFPTYVFKSEYDPTFFKYYMLQKRFKYELTNISPGGAGRNRVMSKKDFLKIKVLIPKLEEQQRIAEVLTSADNEIKLLKKQLEEFQEQKKSLMQKLLTGEVRVKI